MKKGARRERWIEREYEIKGEVDILIEKEKREREREQKEKEK